jgi:hypothetical protein
MNFNISISKNKFTIAGAHEPRNVFSQKNTSHLAALGTAKLPIKGIDISPGLTYNSKNTAKSCRNLCDIQ